MLQLHRLWPLVKDQYGVKAEGKIEEILGDKETDRANLRELRAVAPKFGPLLAAHAVA